MAGVVLLFVLVGVALVVAVWSRGVAGPDAETIDFNVPVSGRLTITQPTQRYVFFGHEGEDITLSMRALDDGLDPFLRLLDAEGFEVAFDDDGGEGLNALLQVKLPYTGDYVVEATSYEQSSTGGFQLLLGSAGGIDESSALFEYGYIDPAAGTFSEVYDFYADAGQTVTIDVFATEGSVLDTFIILYDPDGVEIASDDDGGGGTDSFLELELPVSGVYVVEVRAYQDASSGEFGIYVELD